MRPPAPRRALGGPGPSLIFHSPFPSSAGCTYPAIIPIRHASYSTGVWTNSIPFRRALALQSRGRDCSPASDLAFWSSIIPMWLFSGIIYFHRHRYVAEIIGLSLGTPGAVQPSSAYSAVQWWWGWSVQQKAPKGKGIGATGSKTPPRILEPLFVWF